MCLGADLHQVQRVEVSLGRGDDDVRIGPDGPEPAHFREAFRTRGPSNYPHGKQAETAA